MSNRAICFTLLLCAGALMLPAMAAAADLPRAQPQYSPSTTPVFAPQTGFYFATRSSITMPEGTAFSTAATGRVETEYEIGALTGGALGYRFAPVAFLAPRIEMEGGFGRFAVDRHSIGGVQQEVVDSVGSLQAVTGFISGYVDLDTARAFGMTGFLAAFRPYIGGGVGAAHVTLKKQGASATGVLIDDSDTRFAYHLSAGIGIELAQFSFVPTSFLRNGTVEIGYRRMEVPELSFTARDATTEKTDLITNMITVGFRRPF